MWNLRAPPLLVEENLGQGLFLRRRYDTSWKVTHSLSSMAVIVLNYRTPEITIECLKTLEPEVAANPGVGVILVDNASGDDSVAKIGDAITGEGWTGGWLDFRPLERNLGFAGGNNLILRELLALPEPPPYVLLLNSDTLVHPGCIARCLALMNRDSGIGALSCMLRNPDGTVQNVCRRFPHPFRESLCALGLPWILPRLFGWAEIEDLGWDREAGPRDVDWIGGAFFLARTAALREAGLLDEEFFFLGEDCEWCHRIRRSGWRIRFDPSAEIVHLGGASSDATRVRNRTKSIHIWRARFLIQRKCYGPLAERLNLWCCLLKFYLRLGLLWVTMRWHTKMAADIREELEEVLMASRPPMTDIPGLSP